MKQSPKYDTSCLIEAQHEPGSHGRVLRNKLGIKSKREMERIEWEAQIKALSEIAGLYGKTHRFTAKDICKIHKVWLGDIYEWAGKYRKVNVGKGDFQFAASAYIPRLMEDLENGPLKKSTPCNFKTLDEIVTAIAIVHVELVLIHPFREGNGRAARLLADLMVMQADYPPLDYTDLEKGKWKQYIAAIHAGLNRDYEPMARLFSGLIGKVSLLRKGK